MVPKFFTNLFDTSYLQPPTLDYTSPYLSPAVAPAELLRDLSDMIMIYPCEYDGLRVEAAAFCKKLKEEIGKTVRLGEVESVPHAWDKSPNPCRTPVKVNEYYRDMLRTMFWGRTGETVKWRSLGSWRGRKEITTERGMRLMREGWTMKYWRWCADNTIEWKQALTSNFQWRGCLDVSPPCDKIDSRFVV